MRVLHAPINIANQAWGMAQGLRARGHHAEVWQLGANRYGLPADRTLDVPGSVSDYLDLLRDVARAEFDVLHFHFARTLTPVHFGLPWFWDLPIWRSLGARIVFTFHGSDIRLRSHHLATDEWSFYRHGDLPCDEDVVAAALPVLRTYADAMTVGSVLDLPYAPGAVVVPRVIEVDSLPDPTFPAPRRPTVAHAPSLRSAKGTEFVLRGLEDLRTRGVEFDLDLIEGVPHAAALQRMAAADIVVEKVLGGDLGVTSLEAMALGKVTVARIRPQVRETSPELPVVSVDPDTFVDVMADLLQSPDSWADLGRRGREYVQAHHDAPVVARRLEELYATPPRRPPTIVPGWTAPRAHDDLARAQVRITELEESVATLNASVASLNARNRSLERRVRNNPTLAAAALRRLRRR